MIKKIAIEPELITDWKSLDHCTGHFGFHAGRLIAEYPDYRGWARRVLEGVKKLGIPDVRLAAISAKLGSPEFRAKFCEVASQRPYIETRQWLTNALDEVHSPKPGFDLIFACKNPSNSQKVLVPENASILEDDRCRGVQSWLRPSTPEMFADIVEILVKSSREMIFYDPYFKGDRRHLDILKAVLAKINPSHYSWVEYHNSEASSIHDEGRRGLELIVPSRLTFRLVSWPTREDRHDRFILTERGGIQFGRGLDKAPAEKNYIVTIIDRKAHGKLWGELSSSARPAKVESLRSQHQTIIRQN